MTAKKIVLPLDDRRVTALLAEVQRIQQNLRQWTPGDTLDAYTSLLARAETVGVRSVEVLYCAANAAHHSGDVAAGLELILQAAALDPISPMIRRAVELHASEAHASLTHRDWNAGDESTPVLHALLERAGKADARSHVVLARHLVQQGRAEEARALLESVTRLAPSSREAWALRGELALVAGDTATAGLCARECAAAAAEAGEVAPLPFISAAVAQA